MIKQITIILTLPIILFSLSSCGGMKNTNSKKLVQDPPFRVIEAFYQNWVAGVEVGGSGVNIHLTFSEKDADVLIQNIYFRNAILEAKGNINAPNKFVGYLNNNTKRDVIMDADPMKEAKNTISDEFPFQLKDNEAVVEYWYGGKKNYYKIGNISQRDMIPYPQANPNQHE